MQFNAPLVAGDRFLHIVPGSHLRASTDAEIEASRSESGEMPGALVVDLEPGDIVHYNANLWHRGWNPEGRKRWTLHCAFWRAGATVMKHEHGQREALTRPGHLERMPPGHAAATSSATSMTIPKGTRPPCSICRLGNGPPRTCILRSQGVGRRPLRSTARHLDVDEVSAGRLGAFGSRAVAPYLSGKPDESGL